MPERDLDARIAAVERALTDGDTDLTDLRDASALTDDVSELAARVDDIESRLDDLEAGLQAVRGYTGNVRAVNREVERRASAALAKAEALETAVDGSATQTANAGGASQTAPTEEATDRAAGVDDREARAGGRERSTVGSPPRESTSHSSSADGTGPHRSVRPGPTSGPVVDSTDRGDTEPRQSDETRERAVSDGGSHGSWSNHGPDSDGRAADDDEAGQTEQFIERVRDAL